MKGQFFGGDGGAGAPCHAAGAILCVVMSGNGWRRFPIGVVTSLGSVRASLISLATRLSIASPRFGFENLSEIQGESRNQLLELSVCGDTGDFTVKTLLSVPEVISLLHLEP